MKRPTRIVVIGVSCSGKTTFANQLALKTGLPVTLMDQIMWQPGWEYIGDEATVEKISSVVKEDQWVLEGYISSLSRPEVFDRAEQIVYLDYPGIICAWRYLKRCVKHWRSPRTELAGSPDRFRWSFFWLVLTKGEANALQNLLRAGAWDAKLIIVQNLKEVNKLLSSD